MEGTSEVEQKKRR